MAVPQRRAHLPPPVLAQLAPGWTATLAYRLVPDVTTWRLARSDGSVRFAKVDTAGGFPTLADEADRMVWASAYLPVPAVVAMEQRDGVSVLITEALPGRDATDPAWRNDLPGLVRAFGVGLSAFHSAVGEQQSPFRFDLVAAFAHVHRRMASGTLDPSCWHPEHRHLSATDAMMLLEETAPSTEDLVVCHGDYCPPNVLLTGGRVTGYVDLGELGVADRWWDIAIGGWSTGWNFGTELEALFYDSYGIAPDRRRIAFYRLLYDLVS
jgi:kanamycin kinase